MSPNRVERCHPSARGGRRPRNFSSPPVAPASATVSDAEADGIAVVAAPAEAGLVRQGTMLTVRVTVRNDTAQTLPAGEVVLSVDPAVATGRELSAWFDEDAPPALDRAVARDTVRALEPGAVAVLDLRVGAGELGVDDRSGPRRALVELRADGAVLGSDPTSVVWLSAAEPLPVGRSAIVLPLTTPGIENGAPLHGATRTAHGGGRFPHENPRRGGRA
ncbi:MAG: DUF6049 family protein [Microcella pacifica]